MKAIFRLTGVTSLTWRNHEWLLDLWLLLVPRRSQNNVVTSNQNSRTNSNPPYRKNRIGRIGFLLHASLSRGRGGKRPGAGGNCWRTGGRYATSGVGLWPTRRTVSKFSTNLRRGVYAECTLDHREYTILLCRIRVNKGTKRMNSLPLSPVVIYNTSLHLRVVQNIIAPIYLYRGLFALAVETFFWFIEYSFQSCIYSYPIQQD